MPRSTSISRQPHMVDAVAKLPDLVVGGLNLQKFTKLS